VTATHSRDRACKLAKTNPQAALDVAQARGARLEVPGTPLGKYFLAVMVLNAIAAQTRPSRKLSSGGAYLSTSFIF
jgi:hypothetical protein